MLSSSQCIPYQGTTIMRPASSPLYTTAWNSRNARTRTVNTTCLGVQRPVTTTKIRNGDIARQTVTSQTAWIVTAVVGIGRETGNASLALPTCARSARDHAVCVLVEEMDEDEHASFRISTKTELCMTVWSLRNRLGVRHQPTITRTRDGAIVFPSVSFNCRLFCKS